MRNWCWSWLQSDQNTVLVVVMVSKWAKEGPGGEHGNRVIIRRFWWWSWYQSEQKKVLVVIIVTEWSKEGSGGDHSYRVINRRSWWWSWLQSDQKKVLVVIMVTEWSKEGHGGDHGYREGSEGGWWIFTPNDKREVLRREISKTYLYDSNKLITFSWVGQFRLAFQEYKRTP